MTVTSLDTELAGCADEQLAAIVLRLAELQSGATPNSRIPMTQQPHPRHYRCKSCGHCTPSARMSDDASSKTSKPWWGPSRSNTPHMKAGASHSKTWPVLPHNKPEIRRRGLIRIERCGRQSPCQLWRNSRVTDFIKEIDG